MSKQKVGYKHKKPVTRESEKSSKELSDLARVRAEFNRLFKEYKINMFVKKSFKVIEETNIEKTDTEKLDTEKSDTQIVLSNFLFYPMNSIWTVDGLSENETGFRICVIQKVKKDIFKEQIFDINLDSLTETEWLSSNFLGKEFKKTGIVDLYKDYMKVFYKIAEITLKKKARIVRTSQMGWIQGDKRLHYVPITPNADDVMYDKGLETKFNIKCDYEIKPDDAFVRTLKMLVVTNKNVTIPLLSYTVFSLFTSLVEFESPNMTKFFVCISGGKAASTRFEFANLFCNLFDRRANNLSSLNQNYHSNLLVPEEEIRINASKIRDGIFIINTENNPKKISISRKLLQREDIENMILILNEEVIDQDFVLNISMNEAIVDTYQLSISKNEPYVLTTCLTNLINYYSQNFNSEIVESLRNKKLLRKLYGGFHKLFEDGHVSMDVNKVHYFSCLLIGFNFFLKYGKSIKVINDEQGLNLFEDAVRIFKEQCIMQSSGDTTTTKHKEIHILFLEKLLNLLQVNELPHSKDKNNHDVDNTGNLGWIEEENIIWVKNSIFKKIDDLLSAAGNKTNLTKRKSEIYKKLYDEKVILTPNDEEIVGVTVVKIEKSVNVASKPATVKVFRLDKLKAIELLKN